MAVVAPPRSKEVSTRPGGEGGSGVKDGVRSKASRRNNADNVTLKTPTVDDESNSTDRFVWVFFGVLDMKRLEE